MKAQTKALVASVVVIALALSAVSGITYSWFTDSEQSKIDISTAVVDYEVTWAESENGSEGTKWTVKDGNVTVAGLDANDTIPVVTKIENKSTIKTVYRIVATATLADGHDYTLYDLKNIYIGGVQLNATGEAEGNITLKETVIADWTELNVGSNPSQQNIYITTLESYGSKMEKPIVAYDPSTGEGSDSKDGTYTKDWSQSTEKGGLSISLSIVAVQGDYPYSKMTTSQKVGGSTGDKAVAAMIPENKVLKADLITSSEGNQTVSNVIVDFSDVSTIDDSSTGISTKNKVQVEVKSVDTNASTVTLDLTLWTVTEGQQTSPEQVQNPKFDNPVVITMTVPGKLSEPKITYNGEADGKILSSTINANNTTTVVFSVDHFSEYVIADSLVTTEAGLRESLAAGGYVKLGADIKVKKALECENAGMILDLNGYKIEQDSQFKDEDSTAVIELKSDMTIRNGDLISLSKDSYRVININDLESSVTLTLLDVDVIGPQSGTYTRGISIYGNQAEVVVNITGGSVSAWYYALNIGDYNADVTLNVEDCIAVSGYCAVQTHSKNTKLNFTNCELKGENAYSGGSDNFATIVLNNDDEDTADGSKIVLKDCKIGTYTTGTASEYLLSLRCQEYSVEMDGCQYVWMGEEIGVDEIDTDFDTYIHAAYDPTKTLSQNKLTIKCNREITDSTSLVKYLAQEGRIKLAGDITIDKTLQFQTEGYYNIDLNGKTLTLVNAFVGYNGCTKHSTDDPDCNNETAADVQGVELVIRNGNLKTSTSGNVVGIAVGVGSSFELDDVEFTTSGSGIMPRGDSSKIVVNDSTITAGVYAIGTNASAKQNYNVKIEINRSTLTGECTIFFNVAGSLKIADSTIGSKYQCLLLRAGTAEVGGTTFDYTTAKKDTDKGWATGSTCCSAAVIVGNIGVDAYKADAVLTLTGCKIEFADNATGSQVRGILVAQDGTNGQEATATLSDCTGFGGHMYQLTENNADPTLVSDFQTCTLPTTS